jgi:hypothetical protein
MYQIRILCFVCWVAWGYPLLVVSFSFFSVITYSRRIIIPLPESGISLFGDCVYESNSHLYIFFMFVLQPMTKTLSIRARGNIP